MSSEEPVNVTSSGGLSLKDVDEIEMVSHRISQVLEIQKSVGNLNQDGQLDDVKEAAAEILEQLNEGRSMIMDKKDRIEKLDDTLKQLEQLPKNYKQLTTLDTALIELEHEKAVLRKRLSSLEKLNLCIDVLSYKIYEAQHDYETDMEELRLEKEELLASNDVISQEDLVAMLSEIDKRIQDRLVMHMAAKSNLETKKIIVQKESYSKVQDLNTRIENVEKKRSEVLLELEDQKLFATASERQLIDAEINRLDAKYQTQLTEMKKLQSSGWAEKGSEEKLCALLETKGVKVTKSGRFLTKTGTVITIEEADNMGMFDDLDMPWEKIKKSLASFIPKEKEYDDWDETEVADEDEEVGKIPPHQALYILPSFSITLLESLYSQIASEDVHYLKDSLGKPLTAAMAEILMKRPTDPIHFLGHWLFKYRYNQEVENATKQEISELTAERARIAKERWQAQVQEEAQRAVLNLIVRVEEEILRRELEKAQARQEAESDEGVEEYGRVLNETK